MKKSEFESKIKAIENFIFRNRNDKTVMSFLSSNSVATRINVVKKEAHRVR